jgi:hypothetical protein
LLTQTQWIKPAVWGAIGGAVSSMIIGFTWMGWMLGSTADRIAAERVDSAVIVALTPACVASFMQQPNVGAKLIEFHKIESWKQRQLVEEGGWATPRGGKSPNSGLANACAEELAKAKL